MNLTGMLPVMYLLATIATLAAMVAGTSFSTNEIIHNYLITDAQVRTIVSTFLWGLTVGCWVMVIVVTHFTAI